MSDLRQTAQQALEALGKWSSGRDMDAVELNDLIATLEAALEQQEQEPVAWTDRELELIDGLIEVQLHHAAQCDAIANRTMAERQKGWDMERVALLRKIKSNPPRREWRSLSEEEILPLYNTTPSSHAEMLEFARDIEAALKERNA
jgi:hypothetical protein